MRGKPARQYKVVVLDPLKSCSLVRLQTGAQSPPVTSPASDLALLTHYTKYGVRSPCTLHTTLRDGRKAVFMLTRSTRGKGLRIRVLVEVRTNPLHISVERRSLPTPFSKLICQMSNILLAHRISHRKFVRVVAYLIALYKTSTVINQCGGSSVAEDGRN